ncbi:hypothetical protein ARALYDRAFT_901238 [Arabidopsis lyrata subsp. lyrata]|uniref:Defensin-like domain-containing protein n=1 Tax=Arabidopsis lyrata subsp. lyrata TaxID=81972 RepID=D7LBH4_ARALL|nr:hypothetical protein ARALYDRAFT_901238 [Arabidopsis lyrata subsp. lyrata]
MGITKTIVPCFLVIIFLVSLCNHNVLVLGEVMEKISYDHCDTLCTPYYGWHECLTDCNNEGWATGICASRSPKEPKRCCCQT